MSTEVTVMTRTSTRGNDRNPQPLHALQLADALLRLKTVTQATGLSSATVYRKLAAGEFPEPVRLGARCTRWKAADVRAWIQAQGEQAKLTPLIGQTGAQEGGRRDAKP